MLVGKSLAVALAAGTAIASPILDRRNFAFGTTQVRGANLGGWLVLEPWITPSLFNPYNGAVVDEFTLCENVPNAEDLLQQHWATWATLADFQKLSAAGFNLVRIPVGYWAFEKFPGDTYIQGAADYLDQAIGWARQTGLKVLIDLHGAPLSQNGFDNSGHRGAMMWTSTDTVAFTNSVISNISAKYAASQFSDVVVGIELLNEPEMSSLPGGQGAVQGYYEDGHGIVRQTGSTGVVLHDGFINPSGWNGVLTGQGTIMDHHEYQCFSDNALSYTDHVNQVWASVQQWGTGADKYIIVGEWTAAMTDCTQWLNGYGTGARYDGSYEGAPYIGSCAAKTNPWAWDQEMKTATTNYISAQIQAYDAHTQGWIFWNFKTESSPEWDLFFLMDAGLWPQS